MKRARNTYAGLPLFTVGCVILYLGILIIFCAPHIASNAHAQGYFHHVNWYHGQASVAEKELRAKEQNAREEYKKDRQDMSAHVAVSDNDTKTRAEGLGSEDTPEDARLQNQ